jgi:hypothetical protein
LTIKKPTTAPARGVNVLESLRRKVLEELPDGLVEFFDVLVGLLRQSVRGDSAPHELFTASVKQIHDQRPYLVWVLGRNGFAKANAPVVPASTTAKSVIERFEGVPFPRGNVCNKAHVGPCRYQLPALGREPAFTAFIKRGSMNGSPTIRGGLIHI